MDYKIYSNDYDSTISSVKELKEKLNGIGWTENKDSTNIFIIGGDGSVLKAFRHETHRIDKVNFYAIHSGGLGFYTDFCGCDIDEVIKAIKADKWEDEYVDTIEVTINGKKHYGLNELTIMSPLKPTIFNVIINDLRLQRFRATGIAVATTTGSTGFAKSIGGAVIDTDINALEILEVAACSNNAYRSIGAPVIVSGNKTIKIEADFSSCYFTIDAIEVKDEKAKEVIINKGPKLKFVRHKKISHLERVSNSFVMEGHNGK